MIGALELPTVGWLGAAGLGVIPLIWFTSVSSMNMKNRLTLLALAEFAAAWLFPILSILYIASPLGQDLRQHTGVSLKMTTLKNILFGMRTSENDVSADHATTGSDEIQAAEGEHLMSPDGPSYRLSDESLEEVESPVLSEPESNTKLLLDGLKIMIMNVVIQSCCSLGVYLSLLSNASEAYELTALQSALPTYGIAYALGLGIMFKIVGPHLIADHKYKSFAIFARITIAAAILLTPIIVGSVVPFRVGLAFEYGENACEYAKDDQCLDFFTQVFGENGSMGNFTLPFTFNAFSAGACIDAVFYVLRAALLTCMDLNYMLWSTLVAILAFVPAIVVAVKVPPFHGHAIAFFVAMYVPQFVCCILFAVRLEVNIRRMLKGDKGPWERKSIVGSSLINSIKIQN